MGTPVGCRNPTSVNSESTDVITISVSPRSAERSVSTRNGTPYVVTMQKILRPSRCLTRCAKMGLQTRSSKTARGTVSSCGHRMRQIFSGGISRRRW